MKDASRQSSLSSILYSSLILVEILVFLAFIPLSNYVYGDIVNSNTNGISITNYDSNAVNGINASILHDTSTPNAIKSWQFNSQIQNSITVGNTKIENKSSITSLELVGEGYLITKVNSTRNLSALTLSAWVKPDYSHGSPIFTVISKENQFALSINNIIPPIRTVTFSVFDGMKWQTVNSVTPIGENWTNIVATFDGRTIDIYVNGTLQSSLGITGTPAVSVNGELTTKTIDHVSSDADIVIGAYLNTLRGKTSNQFSGFIENVNLYDSVLDQSQITNLYENNIFLGKLGSTIKSLQTKITNSTINGNLTISGNVAVLKKPANTNNPIFYGQISILDIVAINSTTNTNYTTPAYFIPFEPQLNSIIYTNSTIIQANDTSIKTPINNTSFLNGTSLQNSTKTIR